MLRNTFFGKYVRILPDSARNAAGTRQKRKQTVEQQVERYQNDAALFDLVLDVAPRFLGKCTRHSTIPHTSFARMNQQITGEG